MNARRSEDSAVALHYELVTALRDGTGLREDLASQFIACLLPVLRERLGCETLYIPAPDRRERDRAIRSEFDGRNAGEVCRKYGVSRTRLYEIVAVRDPQ